MNPGDPTPHSPADVLCGKLWKLIESEVVVTLAGQFVRLTVLHHGTETLWQCEYVLHGAGFPAIWWPVKKVTRTITEYRRVS